MPTTPNKNPARASSPKSSSKRGDSPSRAGSPRDGKSRAGSPRSRGPVTPPKPRRAASAGSPAKSPGGTSTAHRGGNQGTFGAPTAHYEPQGCGTQSGQSSAQGATAAEQEAERLDAAQYDLERLAFNGQDFLRHKGSAVIHLKTWTPISSCALPDGRLCVSDSTNRQLMLLSLEGADGPTTLPAPVPVRLVRSLGEGEPQLCSPAGVCARAASEADDGCAIYVYVADRYPKFPRLIRLGIGLDGVETAPRLQWWDRPKKPDSLLKDPTELCLSPDGHTLFVTDQLNHSVLVLDADTLKYGFSIGGVGTEPSSEVSSSAWVSSPPREDAACSTARASTGLLDGPYGIAAYGKQLFVAEQTAHRIAVFGAKPDGTYELAKRLGGSGTTAGRFRRPRGLAIVGADADVPAPLLVVAEAKRVHVLTLHGEPLQLLAPPSHAGTNLWGLSVSAWELLLCDAGRVHLIDVCGKEEGRAAFEAERAEEREEAVRLAAEEASRLVAELAAEIEEKRRHAEMEAEAIEEERRERSEKARREAEGKAAKIADKKAQRAAAAREVRLKEEEEREREMFRNAQADKAREEREVALRQREVMAMKEEKMRKEQVKIIAEEHASRERKALQTRVAYGRAQVAEDAAWRRVEMCTNEAELGALTDAARDATRVREIMERAAQKANEKAEAAVKARAAEYLGQKQRRTEAAERKRQVAEVAKRRSEMNDEEEEVDAAWAGWEEEHEHNEGGASDGAAGKARARSGKSDLKAPSLGKAGSSRASTSRGSTSSDSSSTASSAGRAGEPEGEDKGGEEAQPNEEGEKEEEEWQGAAFQSQWQWPWKAGSSSAEAQAAAEAAAAAATLDENRSAKAVERDEAINRILQRGSTTVRKALGVDERTSDDEVRKRVKKLLILMHPDFTINLPLKGTKQHIRIEAAFKKLVGLRDIEQR